MTLTERLRWMETESKFAHACPDLDQEYLASDHAEAVMAQESVAALYRKVEPMRNPAHWGHDARLWTREQLDDFSFVAGRQWGEAPLDWYLDQLGDA